jgi:hypothetical protein
MHNEPLDQNDLSPNATEQLDQRIVRALEAAPQPRIPADFAARVASQLPARRAVSLTQTHYGQNAMFFGIIATLVAMVALAIHTNGKLTFGLPESLLLAQFIALAVWFTVRRASLS